MSAPGCRLARAGSIGLLVVAGMHTLGHFSPPPTEGELARLAEAMRRARLDLFGMQPSVQDVVSSLSLTMTVTLAALGALGLVAAGDADPAGRTLRRVLAVEVAAVGALVVLFGYYRIAPPLVTLAVVELLFLAALARARTARGTG
jgi:hypothetical protein